MKFLTDKELGDWIKKKRGKLTQTEYGEILGVSKQLLMQYEKALVRPSKAVREKLGIAPGWIVDK